MYQKCGVFCWRAKIDTNRISYLNLGFEEYIGIAFETESIGFFLEEAIELLLAGETDNSKLFSFNSDILDSNSPEGMVQYQNLLNIERFDFQSIEIIVEPTLAMLNKYTTDNSLSPINTQLIENKIQFKMDIQQFSNFVHAITTTSMFIPKTAFNRYEKVLVQGSNIKDKNIEYLLFFSK
jgi:hypothetical protein